MSDGVAKLSVGEPSQASRLSWDHLGEDGSATPRWWWLAHSAHLDGYVLPASVACILTNVVPEDTVICPSVNCSRGRGFRASPTFSFASPVGSLYHLRTERLF